MNALRLVCLSLGLAILSIAWPGVVSAQEVESPQEVHELHGENAHDSEAHADGHGQDAGAEGGEHGDAHGGAPPNPLSVDPDLMIFTAVIFLLLLGVLTKFAWGPIRTALDERESNIDKQIAEAHRSNEEARRLLAEHETRLASSSEEVKAMLEQARKDAEVHRAKVVAEAEAAAKSEKDRAVREIHAAKNSALEDLAKTSVDQAIGLAGNIIRQKLDKSDHAQLIQDALKQFPSEN